MRPLDEVKAFVEAYEDLCRQHGFIIASYLPLEFRTETVFDISEESRPDNISMEEVRKDVDNYFANLDDAINHWEERPD
jgi:Holliday junction resolvase RusA-like endonuclease